MFNKEPNKVKTLISDIFNMGPDIVDNNTADIPLSPNNSKISAKKAIHLAHIFEQSMLQSNPNVLVWWNESPKTRHVFSKLIGRSFERCHKRIRQFKPSAWQIARTKARIIASISNDASALRFEFRNMPKEVTSYCFPGFEENDFKEIFEFFGIPLMVSNRFDTSYKIPTKGGYSYHSLDEAYLLPEVPRIGWSGNYRTIEGMNQIFNREDVIPYSIEEIMDYYFDIFVYMMLCGKRKSFDHMYPFLNDHDQLKILCRNVIPKSYEYQKLFRLIVKVHISPQYDDYRKKSSIIMFEPSREVDIGKSFSCDHTHSFVKAK